MLQKKRDEAKDFAKAKTDEAKDYAKAKTDEAKEFAKAKTELVLEVASKAQAATAEEKITERADELKAALEARAQGSQLATRCVGLAGDVLDFAAPACALLGQR